VQKNLIIPFKESCFVVSGILSYYFKISLENLPQLGALITHALAEWWTILFNGVSGFGCQVSGSTLL